MSDAPEDAGEIGWTLVQISELVRRAEELLLDGVTLVGPQAHAGMAPDARIELGSAQVARIVSALSEGAEICEQLEQLAARLPDGPVDVSHEAVRDAAAADLARGIVDPRRLLVAARLLDVAHGWRALAASLSAGDVVSAWGSLTVEALLGRFRGADAETVARVAEEAGLGRTARFSTCPPERLVDLAAGLRRHASGQPAS